MEISHYTEAFIVFQRALWWLPRVEKVLEQSRSEWWLVDMESGKRVNKRTFVTNSNGLTTDSQLNWVIRKHKYILTIDLNWTKGGDWIQAVIQVLITQPITI